MTQWHLKVEHDASNVKVMGSILRKCMNWSWKQGKSVHGCKCHVNVIKQHLWLTDLSGVRVPAQDPVVFAAAQQKLWIGLTPWDGQYSSGILKGRHTCAWAWQQRIETWVLEKRGSTWCGSPGLWVARSRTAGPTSVSREACRPLTPEPAEWPHLDATTSQNSASDNTNYNIFYL